MTSANAAGAVESTGTITLWYGSATNTRLRYTCPLRTAD